MADVIKGHNTSYARYEELINRKGFFSELVARQRVDEDIAERG